MFNSLRWKFTAGYVLASILVVLVVGLTVFLLESRALSHRVEGSIRSAGDAVKAATASNQESNRNQPPLDAATKAIETVVGHRWLSSNDVFAVLLDPRGRVVANPENVEAGSIGAGASTERALADGEYWHTVTVSGTKLRVKTSPLLTADGELIGFVQAGKSVEDTDAALGTLVLVMTGSGLLGLVLFAVGGYLLAGRAIRPVERSYERQRQFVADASHELRTPLTVVRLNADTLRAQHPDDEAVSDIASEATYMSRLISDLLLLARSDHGKLNVEPATFDVVELVRSVGRSADALAKEAQIGLRVEAGRTSLPVHADPQHVRSAILILIDNALKYTPSGGEIVLSAQRHGADALIEVRDSGVGMTADELTRATDRFYTVRKARSRTKGGTGLGLSIARELMTALGGKLQLESEVGVGTKARLVLPALPATAPLPQPDEGANILAQP